MSTCQTIVQDCDEHVVVKSCGEPGTEGPQGPPGDITTNEESVTDAGIPLWDGVLGNLLRDSGVSITDLATNAAMAVLLDLKQDKETGKGLSEEDFTTALRDKLVALSGGTYLGTFGSLVLLQATYPTASAGDVAYVTTAGNPLQVYQWDEVNATWVLDEGNQLTGSEISTLLFAEADTNNLTDSLLGKINDAVDQATFDAAVDSIELLLDQGTSNVIEEATTARTLSLGDSAKFLLLTNAAGCTITLPNDATALWEDNNRIDFLIEGPVLPTILLGGGVTLVGGSKLAGLAQEDVFSIKRIGPDKFCLWAE